MSTYNVGGVLNNPEADPPPPPTNPLPITSMGPVLYHNKYDI